MPTITLENDPTLFIAETKAGEKVKMDVMELAHALQKQGVKENDVNPEAVVACVREVAYPKEVVGKMDDGECLAFGTKVSMLFEKLGNG